MRWETVRNPLHSEIQTRKVTVEDATLPLARSMLVVVTRWMSVQKMQLSPTLPMPAQSSPFASCPESDAALPDASVPQP